MPAPTMNNPSTGNPIQNLPRAQTPLIGTELVVMSQSGNACVMPSSAFVGPQGTAATVTVSGTTTGAPGTNASVVQGGTPQNATLSFTVPSGLTGSTGAVGPQGIPASSFRNPVLAWSPTALKTADIGVPTQTDAWLDYASGMAFNNSTYNSPANSFSSVNNMFTLGTNQQFLTTGVVPSLGSAFTVALRWKCDTYFGFDYVICFGNDVLRFYMGSATSGQLTDGTVFGTSATFPATTEIPFMLAYGWNFVGSTPTSNPGVYTYYDGHTGSWVAVGTMTSAVTPSGQRIVLHGDPGGSEMGGTYEYGGLLIFNYLPNSTETTNYLAVLNAPTVPVPFRASVQGPFTTDPPIVAAVAAAPGQYGNKVRAGSQGLLNTTTTDQSTLLQSLLTANPGFSIDDSWSITAQHLINSPYGHLDGGHALISANASYTILEQDWIIGLGAATIELQQTAEPTLRDVSVTAFGNSAWDSSRYGVVPTQQLAGIWMGEVTSLPISTPQFPASGRLLGGFASFVTHGVRITAGQYGQFRDFRIGGCNIGMLLECCDPGSGNVDFAVEWPMIFACDIGVFAVANQTGAGPGLSPAITGAANNGGGLIRLTVGSTTGMTTNMPAVVLGVGGVPNANSPGYDRPWLITVVDGTHVDLQGSTFAGAYTSGGALYTSFSEFQAHMGQVTLAGGKANFDTAGPSGTNFCQFAVSSPSWRNNGFIDGDIKLKSVGAEYLANNFTFPWDVGKTVYTKNWDPLSCKPISGSYPASNYLFGTTPALNVDGQAFLQLNANNKVYQSYYIGRCGFWSEGVAVYVQDPDTQNSNASCGQYKTGPYGVFHIVNGAGDGGNSTYRSALTVADDPATGAFYLYGTLTGSCGYAMNVYRWPDISTEIAGGAFDTFCAGGGDGADIVVYSQGTNLGVASAAVSAGGSSYAIGDILIVSSGTFVTAAVLQVLTLSGSAVATVAVVNPGFYKTMPSNPASVTGGHGTSATFTLTSQTNFTQMPRSSLAAATQDNVILSAATRAPGFPRILDPNSFLSANTTTVATEGPFKGRTVRLLTGKTTNVAAFGTLQTAITVANNQPVTVNFSANAPATGTCIVIDQEVFYIISGGGGTTGVVLSRGPQNHYAHGSATLDPASNMYSRYQTHTVGTNAQAVGAYIGGSGTYFTTDYLLDTTGSTIPAGGSDISNQTDAGGFIYIYNPNNNAVYVNWDIFANQNARWAYGTRSATNVYAWAGRQHIPAHFARSLRFVQNGYNSDYKIGMFLDALQTSNINLWVTDLAFINTNNGTSNTFTDGDIQDMLFNHRCELNLL
jgi:hypothetical protein